MSNNKTLFKSLPIFVPRVMDTTISDLGITFPALIIDSHHIEWRRGVVDKISKLTNLLIVDPVTVHLLFPAARKKKNFMKLPYPKNIKPETLYSSAKDRLEKVIKPAIDDQIKKGGDLIIAPSFFTEDTDDIKFPLNLTLLSETLRYIEQQKIDKPIFANIYIGKGALRRNTVINYIVSLYRDDFKGKVDGYCLNVNDFDAEKADIDELIGISSLIFKLSNGNNVFVKYVGGFGEVLCAIGASGFSSSLDGGEIFSVNNFEQRTKGFGRKGSWTYVAEIFDHINDTELKKIGYTCNCPYCKGSLPATKKDKKLHFLYQKIKAMKSLESLTREQKIELMITKLEKAIAMVISYRRQYAVGLSQNYLQNWLAVLKDAKTWEYETEQDAEELNQLLKQFE